MSLNLSLKQIDGIKYEYAEILAEKMGYSVFHFRHLARLYKKGDRIKGLRSFKYRNRWVVDVDDAYIKLVPREIREDDKRGVGITLGEGTAADDWFDTL